MATGNKVYMSTNRGVYFAIFLFLVITFSTFWLYYQNTDVLSDKTKDLKLLIKSQEGDLEKLKNKDILQVFSLLKTNMGVFNIKEKTSNIPVLINKIEDIGREYDILFKTFSYSDGKINLKAEARQISIDDNPSKKITKFIGDFRRKIEYNENNGKIKEKIIEPKIKDFNLEFIKRFSGKGKIDFDIILKINPKEYITGSKNNLEKIKEKIEKLKKKQEDNGKNKGLSIAEKIKLQNEKAKEQK